MLRHALIVIALIASGAEGGVDDVRDGLPRPPGVEFEYVGSLRAEMRYRDFPGKPAEPSRSSGVVRGVIGATSTVLSDVLLETVDGAQIPLPRDPAEYMLSVHPAGIKDAGQERFVVIVPERVVTWRVLRGGHHATVMEVGRELDEYRRMEAGSAAGAVLLTHKPPSAGGLTFAELLEQSVPPAEAGRSADGSLTIWRGRSKFGDLQVAVNDSGSIASVSLTLYREDLPDETVEWLEQSLLSEKLLRYELEASAAGYALVNDAQIPSTGTAIERWRGVSGRSYERKLDFEFRFSPVKDADELAAALLAQIPDGTEARRMRQDPPYMVDGIREEWRAGRVERIHPTSVIQVVDQAVASAAVAERSGGGYWIMVGVVTIILVAGAAGLAVLVMRWHEPVSKGGLEK